MFFCSKSAGLERHEGNDDRIFLLGWTIPLISNAKGHFENKIIPQRCLICLWEKLKSIHIGIP